jgi:hypothetical protein
MTLLRLLPALAFAALLSACGQPSEEASAVPPPEPAAAPAAGDAAASAVSLAVSLDPEGLRLVTDGGSTRLLHFERPAEEAMAVLTTVLGEPASRGINSECGAGPTDIAQWSNGLSVLFLNGAFAGWSVDGASAGKLTTMDGVGVGTSRQSLSEAFAELQVEESTLGLEFTAGAYSGLIDKDGPDGKISAMWAGTSCVFR